jgi:hypothetical protein
MSAATAKIVLSNRTLRWSTPERMNDVYDTQFDLTLTANLDTLRPKVLDRLWKVYKGELDPVDTTLGGLIKLLRHKVPNLPKEEVERHFGPAFEEALERMKRSLPRLNEDLRQYLRTSKMLCLTDRPNSPVMWAFYAEYHTGVVLRFRSIPAFDSLFGLARAVDYLPCVPALADEDNLADMFSAVGTLDKGRVMDRLMYTKSEAWAHEREWRICSGSGWAPAQPFEDNPFRANELDGIICGMNMPSDTRSDIAKLASNFPNVEFLTTKRSSTFEMAIVPHD